MKRKSGKRKGGEREDEGSLLLEIADLEGLDIKAVRHAATALQRSLKAYPSQLSFSLVLGEGSTVELPSTAIRLLVGILEKVAEGHAVTLTSREDEMSTREAAELLGVSRPHVVKLVDAGVIPHRKAGTHRRILLRDILEYKRAQDKRHAFLDELANESQELGLYDMDPHYDR